MTNSVSAAHTTARIANHETPALARFRRMAWITLAALYFLIMVGASVRASGAFEPVCVRLCIYAHAWHARFAARARTRGRQCAVSACA